MKKGIVLFFEGGAGILREGSLEFCQRLIGVDMWSFVGKFLQAVKVEGIVLSVKIIPEILNLRKILGYVVRKL